MTPTRRHASALGTPRAISPRTAHASTSAAPDPVDHEPSQPLRTTRVLRRSLESAPGRRGRIGALDRADRSSEPQLDRILRRGLPVGLVWPLPPRTRRPRAGREVRGPVITDGRGYERGWVFNVALLAHTHAQRGDVSEACAVGQEAAAAASGLQSHRGSDRQRSRRAPPTPPPARPSPSRQHRSSGSSVLQRSPVLGRVDLAVAHTCCKAGIRRGPPSQVRRRSGSLPKKPL
jgi:hypothetical protein